MNDKVNEEVKYWQDVEKKVLSEEEIKGEFSEGEFDSFKDVKKGRRDFLKIMGIGITAMPLVSCVRIPVKKALPYLNKSDAVTPGVANWYATYHPGNGGAALLLKNREGRPIKVEGNALCSYSRGGTLPYYQSSILSLYDAHRFKNPSVHGKETSWQNIDREVLKALNEVSALDKKMVLVTSPSQSPTFSQILKSLQAKYKNLEVVVYHPFSRSSFIEANQAMFGVAADHSYNFKNADYVLSFGADFLGTMPRSHEYTADYAAKRDLAKSNTMLKHIQVESLMSLTGANADIRIPMEDKDLPSFLMALLSSLQRLVGKQVLPVGVSLPETNLEAALKMANELIEYKGRSLVLCDSKNKYVQTLINGINALLGNYGQTVFVYNSPYALNESDASFENFVDRLKTGEIGSVLFYESNPLYNYYDQEKLISGLEKVSSKIFYGMSPNETSKVCQYILPTNYYLESWGDHFKGNDSIYFTQPVIQPLFGSRMGPESLLALLDEEKSYHNYLKSFAQKKYLGTTSFDKALEEGFVKVSALSSVHEKINFAPLAMAFAVLLKKVKKSSDYQLKLYEKMAILEGEEGNNPWAHELPDPVTKATWGNYFMVSPAYASAQGLKTGQVISVKFKNYTIECPLLIQPGLAANTFGLAVGYGRKEAGKVAKDLGANAYPFQQFVDGTFQDLSDFNPSQISITKKHEELALTQTHHSMEGRDIIRESTFGQFLSKQNSGNEKKHPSISMWKGHDKKGHQWGMVIDLTKCTGCSGCIISCNAENNIPVVGREEVVLRREMHWLRLDRYYKGEDQNPEVTFMPVMCQHCDNAPCESVCPVLATVQSSDGLNQQVYNRCVGTRYCANNCPYKVRRFNWFDYPHSDKNANMVLNPDVVVRSRGVMEKCSLCVQRIQEGKLKTKVEGRDLVDDDIKTACQQSCPAGAIYFGDMNDPNSSISKFLKSPRNYKLLDELNVQPRVSYLTKIRNKD